MRKLKSYAMVLGLGAVLGIAVAETWRRRVLHDSYANYLPPPPPEREATPASEPRSGGRVLQAAKGVWRPVAASARADALRMRRIRSGAPRPRVEQPTPPEAPTGATGSTVEQQP